MKLSIKNIKYTVAAATLLFISATITWAHDNYAIATRNYLTADEDTTEAEPEDTISETEDPKGLAWPNNIKARIDQLRKSSIFETSTVGMMVYDLTADSVIYSYNERQLMRPASTLKTIVAIAALDKLGGNYKYKTVMKHTGDVINGALQGNLYIKGGFDPMIDNNDLDTFIDSLKSMDIDTIKGNIYADVSMKDTDRLGEGWCWDDDNPVLSPLLVSREDEFVERLANRLQRNRIVLEGDQKSARTPKNARTICIVERNIDDVMHRMLKKSDNLYSESVFYQLAATDGTPATARQGRNIINRLITKLGYKPSKYYIADGCGLSLYNYVTPELEVSFLKYAYHHNDILLHLMQHLPIAGEDGTLNDRMKKGYAHGNVHAKTGTVTGVSALAGYCNAANGHRLCFSIINMGIRHASSGRNFQDRVCEALCRP